MESLYNTLLELTKTNDAFYFADQERDGAKYRIFSYRLASYSEFCLPHARESRGIMFEITPDGKFLRIASRPFKKFFNLNENPFTIGLEGKPIRCSMEKMDGSLISTYIRKNGVLGLKSKTSLFSDQARMAEDYLAYHPKLWYALSMAAKAGVTVNLEFTSPANQIVVKYDQTNLTILGARANVTGELLPPEWFDDNNLSDARKYYVKTHDYDWNYITEILPHQTHREGVVTQLEDGELVKIKTNWYLALHKAKDSIVSDRRLFEAILLETSDDLKALFIDDGFTSTRILSMEKKVIPQYNAMIKAVEDFYSKNKDLPRKDYAIKGQMALPEYFGLAMCKYLGKDANYREFARKNYKLFGIKEDIDCVV